MNILKALREAEGLTQEEAAEAFGLSKSGYVKIEGGERKLSSERMEKAAEVFGKDKFKHMMEYLDYVRENRKNPDVRKEFKEFVRGPYMDALEKAQRSVITSFDPDEHDINPNAGAEPRMIEGREGRDVGDPPKGSILQVDVSLGMGGGGITHVTDLMSTNGESYAAEGIKGFWQLPPEVVASLFRVPPHRIRCFEAHGDSMEPTVANGDYVFVDIGHRVPSPPGIYALADALGGVILKRVEISSKRGSDPIQVRLISDNPHHTPEDSTLDEVTITGRYLGRLTAS